MAPDYPTSRSSRPVAIWLLIGVFMIIVQVVLGGITRLTGSGLSITEWKPIMGALPPMNEEAWQQAFEKYKQIAQYKYLNAYFDLSDFKAIFFWEWFHRLWARLIGVVFLIPFIIFLLQRRFRKDMIRPMIILFLLGGLQGLVGWIMVQSGLDDSELLYVSHYKLAIHFIFALALLCYTLWFALKLLIPRHRIVVDRPASRLLKWILILFTIQLVYGAFMAGLKIAAAAPTWPDINGGFLPADLHAYGPRRFPGASFLTDHPIMIHFIHRNLAYLLTILIIVLTIKLYRLHARPLRLIKTLPLLLVLTQVVLGISSVLYASKPHVFLWLGVAHQFIAMLLLLSLTWLAYQLRSKHPRA